MTHEDDIDPEDDLFGDYNRTAPRNPFEGKTPEEIEALQKQWKAPRRKSTSPRGKPEKHNQDRIWRHLVQVYGAMPRRVNSGQWQTAEGDFVMGAKAGTSDLLVLVCYIINETVRIGVYCAIETKSMQGRASEAQERFIARVLALGGIACVARTPLDVDTAIDAHADKLSKTLGVPVRPARMGKRPDERQNG